MVMATIQLETVRVKFGKKYFEAQILKIDVKYHTVWPETFEGVNFHESAQKSFSRN